MTDNKTNLEVLDVVETIDSINRLVKESKPLHTQVELSQSPDGRFVMQPSFSPTTISSTDLSR